MACAPGFSVLCICNTWHICTSIAYHTITLLRGQSKPQCGLCRVKEHCIQRGLAWDDSLASTSCAEQEYYEDLLRFYRYNYRVGAPQYAEGCPSVRARAAGRACKEPAGLQMSLLAASWVPNILHVANMPPTMFAVLSHVSC